ncbi:helix-turn-helix domain-containing protein [Halegenticoccus soli]|uniref:helix-turn-helix domain-containing protein n=1 Tax=Halegenticoccus soli TaxID=1985678 RepID=UPI000C6CC1E9|nr:helix-turn-helix domain-containing protein [Halegenticoccus soli]
MGEQTPDRRRNEHGQYADRIPLDRVMGVFEARDDRARPLTATDVMEALGCSRRTAHNKLNALTERGALDTRKVGARSRVWWVPIERPVDPEVPSDGRPAAVSRAIETANLPGSGPTLEARREALSAAYDYLAEYPEAKKADFLRDVYHEHSAGFESAEGWWNAIQPALKQLPGVDPPKERGHIWHFLGG